jgi:hypothetical protein
MHQARSETQEVDEFWKLGPDSDPGCHIVSLQLRFQGEAVSRWFFASRLDILYIRWMDPRDPHEGVQYPKDGSEHRWDKQQQLLRHVMVVRVAGG